MIPYSKVVAEICEKDVILADISSKSAAKKSIAWEKKKREVALLSAAVFLDAMFLPDVSDTDKSR